MNVLDLVSGPVPVGATILVLLLVYLTVDPPHHITRRGVLKYGLFLAAEIVVALVLAGAWTVIEMVIADRFGVDIRANGGATTAVLRFATTALVELLLLAWASSAGRAARDREASQDEDAPSASPLWAILFRLFRTRGRVARVWTGLSEAVIQAERDRAHLWVHKKAGAALAHLGDDAAALITEDYIEAHVTANEQIRDEAARGAIARKLRRKAREAGLTPLQRVQFVLAIIRGLPPGYQYLRGRNLRALLRSARRGPAKDASGRLDGGSGDRFG